ncbi:hypothetical protein Tco_1510552, partial [Tanacetum coccineum]
MYLIPCLNRESNSFFKLKWEESSKGLNKLLNSQMSAKDKNGLGYGTQLDEMSNKSETDSDISMSVFEVRSSDEEITLVNDRFSKADGYHDVPPPITGNFLTLRADISFAGLDEYVIRKKLSTSEKDNAKRVNHQKISNKLKYPQARRTFVPSGVLTRIGLVNLVRPNRKKAVHTVSTARPISTARPVSTARPFAPKIAQTGSAIRPIYLRMDNVRPRASYSPIKRVKNMTTDGTRAVVNTGKGKMDNALKKSRWVWRPKGNYMDHESKEKGSFILKKFEEIQRSVYRIMEWWIVSLVNTARPTLSIARLGIKVGAARQKFVLLVTVTTVDQDFLASSLIHHALTINAIVDSKAVVVTEASIR